MLCILLVFESMGSEYRFHILVEDFTLVLGARRTCPGWFDHCCFSPVSVQKSIGGVVTGVSSTVRSSCGHCIRVQVRTPGCFWFAKEIEYVAGDHDYGFMVD
ncbi:hypothetical protein Droror1_Dr00020433 [Drosera rotundifolia]